MSERRLDEYKLGWIGTGRMGFPLARRLVEAGCDLAVYNRTKSKAEPLTDLGARVVDTPADLAERDIVFTMVAGNDDFREVALGAAGVLTGDGARPSILIDSSTVSEDVSNEIRARGREVGTALLAAKSSNPVVSRSSSRARKRPTRRHGRISRCSVQESPTWATAKLPDS